MSHDINKSMSQALSQNIDKIEDIKINMSQVKNKNI